MDSKVNPQKNLNHLSNIVTMIVIMMIVQNVNSYGLISNINADDLELTMRTFGNLIGLSLYFDDFYPHMNDPMLRGYLNNSRLNGRASNLFHNTIHMPLGYKYKCDP